MRDTATHLLEYANWALAIAVTVLTATTAAVIVAAGYWTTHLACRTARRARHPPIHRRLLDHPPRMAPTHTRGGRTMTTAVKPLPPHGSEARYKGTTTRPPCHCRRCVTGWTQAGQRRHLLRLAGKPASLTPTEVAQVIAHIRDCQNAGMSQNLIGRKAGIAQSTVSRLLTRPQAGCLRAQGERILAVQIGDFDDRGDRPSTGTVRRVRSLYLAGHGPGSISDVTALSEAMITDLAGGKYPTVSAHTEAVIRRAVTTLAGQAGSSVAARRRAQLEGWAPLGAWDDIDDPDCKPDAADAELGFRERAELRREEIIHFAWHGDTPEQILARLNGEVSISTVRQIVQDWRTGQKRNRRPKTEKAAA